MKHRNKHLEIRKTAINEFEISTSSRFRDTHTTNKHLTPNSLAWTLIYQRKKRNFQLRSSHGFLSRSS